jgi:hypothetical protein
MALSRPKKAGLLALGLVAIVVISAFKIKGMLERGEPVFWLAELWAPTAFVSIGLVMCIEFLMPHEAPAKAGKSAPKARKKARA